ncbi:MAG TPA: prephenate dehydrogenase/arogenate dehydrogenase family protein, partial [Lachnospiraceae bacterium]|nr:prephenate dehydrogenase/arogenate dehydrogenase family protein [Lachnospiraceae bacterium]
HNREYEGGVLRIEFYQEEAIERSTKILCEKGYSLHNKN